MADQPNLDDLRIERPDEAPPRRRGWLVVALALLIVVAGGLFFWRTSAVPTVETARVRELVSGAGSGSVLEASGYVTARRKATVSSKTTGKLTEVLVEEGMRVDDGQVLARLDDSLVRRQLALAEAQLAAARSELTEIEVRRAEAELTRGRTERLVEAGVATEARLDADKAAVDSLSARLAAAREQVAVAERAAALRRQELDDTVVRAPFAGVAVSKDAQPGEMVSPISAGGGFTRTGISTIVDMSSLEIEVDVNEAYINRVTDDQPATAVLDAYPDWRIPARVITTVPTADRQKATVKVRLGFEELDPRILPDMGVRVSFLESAVEAAAPTRVLVVPRPAVRTEGGQTVAWVVDDERLERRAITVGAEAGEDLEIAAGLAAGEEVVVDGPPDLEPGARVKIEE